MGSGLPLDDDAEAQAVLETEATQGVVDAAQVRRASVGDDKQDPDEQGAHAELAGWHAHGQHRF